MIDIRDTDFTAISQTVLAQLPPALKGKTFESIEFRDAPEGYTGPIYAVRGGNSPVPQVLYVDGQPLTVNPR